MPVVAVRGHPILQEASTRQTPLKARRVSCSYTEEERGRLRCVWLFYSHWCGFITLRAEIVSIFLEKSGRSKGSLLTGYGFIKAIVKLIQHSLPVSAF